AEARHTRTSLRRRLLAARGRARRGELSQAAEHLNKVPFESLRGSDRRAARRAVRSVRSSAFRQIRRGSRAGDAVATQDGLIAVDALRQSGQLGIFSRFRAWRAERKAMSRTARSASRAA